jgi:hypothetical protein
VICLFHLDVICSSICPVCTTSLIHVLWSWFICCAFEYGNLLI